MALFDEIQKNLSALASQRAPTTDETQKAQRLLRAKSGRAVTGEGIGEGPSVAEQAAVQQTQLGLQQMQPQIGMQKESLGLQQQAQTQQQQQAEQQIAQARKFDTIESRIRADTLLRDLERDRGSLDLDRDRARLEQVGTLLALQDRKYVDQLQNEGRRARLEDQSQFQDELSRSVFGANEELLKQRLGDQSVLSAKKRDFNRVLAQMNIGDAIAVLKNELANQRAAAPWELGGSLAQTGVQAYGAYETGQEKKATEARQQRIDNILSGSSSSPQSLNESLLTSRSRGIV